LKVMSMMMIMCCFELMRVASDVMSETIIQKVFLGNVIVSLFNRCKLKGAFESFL
jgi:hypothetical protein